MRGGTQGKWHVKLLTEKESCSTFSQILEFIA